MTTQTRDATVTRTARRTLNKVPEVTVFFWIITILCTTVGESVSDYVNATLGSGLTRTTLVVGALLTAAGDWTLDLTGWTPGPAVLLPASLLLATLVAWRLGAGAVLSFWIAYILTRPLGANLGVFLALPRTRRARPRHPVDKPGVPRRDPGSVVHLTVTRRDRTELQQHDARVSAPAPRR